MANYQIRDIQDALWRQAKARAAMLGKSIKRYLIDLIKSDLKDAE